MRAKLLVLILSILAGLTFASTAQAQMPIGQCLDRSRNQAFAVYPNFYMVQVGNPANQGQAVRDPSGFTFMRVPAVNPMIQAFFIGWNGELFEINRNGRFLIGGCNFNMKAIPPDPGPIYQPPQMAQWAVPTPQGMMQIPQNYAQFDQRYVHPLMTSEAKARQCMVSSDGERDAFGNCMVDAMLGQKERAAFECSKRESDRAELAICLVGATGGENERRAATQLSKCYEGHGENWDQYPLCMAEQNMDPNAARLLGCVRQQSEEGNVNFMGTAICYGAGSLGLNPELQIAVQCAMTSGGEPITFAGCTGGQLTARELNKCLQNGVGSHDCFGPNNEVVKGLAAVGINIRQILGPNNTLVQAWNTGVNDLRNGPGPNNDAVRFMRNVSNDLTRGPGRNNDVVKAIDNVVPGFRDLF